MKIRTSIVLFILFGLVGIVNTQIGYVYAGNKTKSADTGNSVVVGPWKLSVLSFETKKSFPVEFAGRIIRRLEGKNQNVLALVKVRCEPVRKYTLAEKTAVLKLESDDFVNYLVNTFGESNDMLIFNSSFELLYVEGKPGDRKLIISLCITGCKFYPKEI